MKNLVKISFIAVAVVLLASCSNGKNREVQYMPDMYTPVPYEADMTVGLSDNASNLKPVAGTIARGQVPYEFPNSNAGYDAAKAELKSPLAKDEKNLENGKKMYDIYCISCHGKKGDGNGYLSETEKFGGIPNYKDRDITEGSIYHVIMHGRNLMGSHSSQLTIKERWQVVQYVEKLRSEL